MRIALHAFTYLKFEIKFKHHMNHTKLPQIASEHKLNHLTESKLLRAFLQVCFPAFSSILTSRHCRVLRLYDSPSHDYNVTSPLINHLKHHKNNWIYVSGSHTKYEYKGLGRERETHRVWGVILLTKCITTFHHLNTRRCMDHRRIRISAFPRRWVDRDEPHHEIWMSLCDFHCCCSVVSCC